MAKNSSVEKFFKYFPPSLWFAIISYFVGRWDASRSTSKSDEQLEEMKKLCSTIADLLTKILSKE
jgi:hypothetical protein